MDDPNTIGMIVGIIINLALSSVVGTIASRHYGRSYSTWFILSLLFSWIIVGFILFTVGKSKDVNQPFGIPRLGACKTVAGLIGGLRGGIGEEMGGFMSEL